jgi:putative redox protein
MSKIHTKYIGNSTASTETSISEKPIQTKVGLFDPVDLLSTSLGSCIVSYIAYISKKNNIDVSNLSSIVNPTMNAQHTKVSDFDIIIRINNPISEEDKVIIEHAAKNCPVSNTIASDVKKNFTFIYN